MMIAKCLAFTLLSATLTATPASARWYTASSEHFIVYADDSQNTVRRYAEQLELYDKALRYFTKTEDAKVTPSGRVTVFLLSDHEAVAKLTGDDNIGGVYLPRAGASVAITARPTGSTILRDGVDYGTFFHEYAHHFMLTTWSQGAFPAWFVEGFAEMVGSAVIGEDGAVTLGSVPNNASWDLHREKPIPVETLLVADPNAQSLTNGFYGRAWLLTHYLMLGGTERQTLGRYIADIANGATAAEAAKTFGDMAALDKRLDAYSKRHSLPGLPITADKLVPGTISIRPLTEGEAAVMPVRIRTAFGVNPRTAAEVAVLARRLAEPFPNDAAAQVALAQAEMNAGHLNEAEAAADRVLAVEPRSIDALLAKGNARMLIAAREQITNPARWKEIRGIFGQAAELDRTDPRPLIAYHRSFWEARADTTPDARDALLLAQQLAPQDVPLRYRTGRVLASEGETAEALPLLRGVANDPHNVKAGATARRLVEALMRKDQTAVKAIIAETRPLHAGEVR
ncbi:tetratricopeptide repeat protein [Sphingomonas sp.]|uniref:tetratricopeptide repeat protein n=1 Tax=Sphingomonas sp. TaxID=28214 RepID=UPI0035AF83A1